jgi:hypothetical protein
MYWFIFVWQKTELPEFHKFWQLHASMSGKMCKPKQDYVYIPESLLAWRCSQNTWSATSSVWSSFACRCVLLQPHICAELHTTDSSCTPRLLLCVTISRLYQTRRLVLTCNQHTVGMHVSFQHHACSTMSKCTCIAAWSIGDPSCRPLHHHHPHERSCACVLVFVHARSHVCFPLVQFIMQFS